jgi:hypothetical protein
MRVGLVGVKATYLQATYLPGGRPYQIWGPTCSARDSKVLSSATSSASICSGSGTKSLTDTDSLPVPEILATEIADKLEAALEQFTKIAARLGRKA